jgi:hypothetical protein
MTLEQINLVLRSRYADLRKNGEARWQVTINGFKLMVAADRESDRVRIMIPVAQVDQPDSAVFRRLLEANFSSALDARYAIHGDILWAVYVAPMAALPEHLLDAALNQVLELARTTGTSYTASPPNLGLGQGILHVH